MVQEHIEEAEILVGDETFISIAGEDAYWWISYNPETAAIVTQQVATKRDTRAAAELIQQTIQQAPKLTYFVSDAWDAYALALLYLGQQQDDVPIKADSACSLPKHIIVKYNTEECQKMPSSGTRS